ncbi:L-2-amino-thiazoline-4-carboxylic acid hydrolase [Streptomyces sp. 3N207]|uniref:L-2-amino-thiazoline-4-carboxylic acid hydrolase n=1 Tax=Streptomyces sp. 3N207 TaxID=3457417 RepID=UPI003FD1D5BD
MTDTPIGTTGAGGPQPDAEITPLTAEGASYEPEPGADTQAVIDAFQAALPSLLRDRGIDDAAAEELIGRMKTSHAELEDASGAWHVDDAARHHVRLTSLVIAGSRLLAGLLPPPDVREVLTFALNEPLRETILTGAAAALDHAPDAFRAMVDFSKARENHFFGAGFTFERPRDDDGVYQVDVHRCLYHEHLAAHGAAELTPVFCAFDANWIDAIDPDRHGFTFERRTTIGAGGRHCPFHFRRVAPNPSR